MRWFKNAQDELVKKRFKKILEDKKFCNALQLSSNNIDVNSMRNIFFIYEGWLLHKYRNIRTKLRK